MARFKLRWADRSESTQDWLISNGDSFTLQPDYVREARITINNDHTFELAVSTEGGIAAARLSYTAADQSWALTSHTPLEWELAVSNDIVTVRCKLEDIVELHGGSVGYETSAPAYDSGL